MRGLLLISVFVMSCATAFRTKNRHRSEQLANATAAVDSAAAPCQKELVQRRREAGTNMCSCRRRSGPSSTGLYTCQGNTIEFPGPSPTPSPTTPGRRRSGGSSSGKVTIVSYNLMSWCTQSKCGARRMKTIVNGINRYRPAVLGTQEHDDGGYDRVRGSLKPTGLTHRGSGTYYDAGVVSTVGGLEKENIYYSTKYNQHRKVSGQIYKINGCSGSKCEFAFFNTHWDHAAHDQQANKVISFMKRISKGRPMVLTGDFNVWGSKWSIDHIKNKLNMKEASDPDRSSWCTGGKVDFILASRDGWEASGAVTDSNNCDTGCGGNTCSKSSDHKLLKADLKRT